MKRPIVLVSGQKKRIDNDQIHYGTNYQFIEAIHASGGVPLVLSDISEVSFPQLAELSDALILTGGQDINPLRYNQTNQDQLSRNVDFDRDEFEFLITEIFVKQNKPILGICRGMQILNIHFGGDLYQDIPSQLGINYPFDVDHEITSVSGSFISSLFGERFLSNSLHHQSVKTLGRELVPSAYDSNHHEILEAFCHERLPIYGVQWHPEKMCGRYLHCKNYPDMGILFDRFLKGDLNDTCR